jgi:hypothetical protein
MGGTPLLYLVNLIIAPPCRLPHWQNIALMRVFTHGLENPRVLTNLLAAAIAITPLATSMWCHTKVCRSGSHHHIFSMLEHLQSNESSAGRPSTDNPR